MSNITLKFNYNNYNENTEIWKYFDFSSFIYLLLDSNLVFKRFDIFQDKLEGIMPESAQRDYDKYLLKLGIINLEERQNRVNNETKNIMRFKKWSYANCWSIGDYENYALWKIYLKNQIDGIAIHTTIKQLINSIEYNSSIIKNKEPIYISDVFYGELIYNDISQHKVCTTKIKAYDFEKELRLYFINQRDFNVKPDTYDNDIYMDFNEEQVKLIKVNLKELIKEIYISPFSQDWFIKTFQDLINNKFPDLNLKIINSKIKE